MKAGILTFHDTLNYGASLQCYALQKKLNDMGVQTEVVDYKCPKFEREYSPFFVGNCSLNKIAYMLFAFRMNVIKQKKKREFQEKFLPLSTVYDRSNISKANDVYDLFITGSDQVWNWKLTDFDKTYFIDFAESNKRKYSYAASFGFKNVDEDKEDEYRKLLSGYTRMSVRENDAAELVKKLTSNIADVVCDPVFLLSKEEWEKMTYKVDMDNYILLYSINDTAAYEYAVRLASETGKKLVYFNAPIKKIGKFIAKRNVGPVDFLSWFLHADYVITDSFHGTAFSVIFEKQFVSLMARQLHNGNSRISSLLNILNLSDRVVSDAVSVETVKTEIRYDEVKKYLSEYVQVSEEYLRNIAEDYFDE